VCRAINKSALLHAALKRHFAEVTEAVELVCQEQEGRTLRQMATALITAFLQAKMRDAKRIVAFYSVSSDEDGAKIAQQLAARSNKAIVRLLATACEPFATDPQLVASMLQGAMIGVSRMMLESGAPEKYFDTLRRELIFMAARTSMRALQACRFRKQVPLGISRRGTSRIDCLRQHRVHQHAKPSNSFLKADRPKFL